ncbi:hypothetical protein BGZ61DRAFT_541685 [Ilyonectria robusta]|uniref:uncharacterized protein n=1 Tax=Ilyonectria robusta TaxID=1079257 RepID=UPI001E8CB8C7|nr:uncharacterized protein BGZ61DRAFT_541685 [Ilyonectria robusta]KAH8653003.1 hypothetical protein BGZ61DRAFT_541685 [Ilyonectria robusta]
MSSFTKQPSRLFNLKLIHRYFPKDKATGPRAERSSQSSPGQRSRPKGKGSVGSNCSSPGLVDDQTESETSHEDDYQHHQTYDEIWDIFFKHGSGETKDDVEPLLQKKQYPALLSSAELRLLEQPSPTPNKPLPDIPTQVRPLIAPQRVPRVTEDRRVPAWSPQNTRPKAQKAGVAYSLFPKPVALPPRTTAITPSWRSLQETHKPQRPLHPGANATKHAHRHIAELYHDPANENEKTVQELREEAIHDLLGRVVRNSPIQKSITGSRGRNFIRSFDEVVMPTEVEVTQSSPRSPPGSALLLPPVEYDWDKNTPILSRPSSPKDLRPEASSETSPEAAAPPRRPTIAATEARPKTARDHDRRPTTASQETRPKPTTRGRRPTGASLESGTKTSSLESRPIATSETSPETSSRKRPVSIISTASQSATYLPMPDSEPPVFTKKSATSLQKATKLEPLQLPPLHQLPLLPPLHQPPLLPPLHQPPLLPRRDTSVFAHDDGKKYRRFGFLCIHRRGSSDGRRSGKNKFFELQMAPFQHRLSTNLAHDGGVRRGG